MRLISEDTEERDWMRMRERERIDRDVHDAVMQRLFATGLELQALATRLRPTQGELGFEPAIILSGEFHDTRADEADPRAGRRGEPSRPAHRLPDLVGGGAGPSGVSTLRGHP
ncbi:MAG: histidine kinase [Egibacteraceae bacterium]